MKNVAICCVLLVVPCLILAAGVEQPKTDKSMRAGDVPAADSLRSYLRVGELLDEGFEGSFPPASWTVTNTHATTNWTTDTSSPAEGLTDAYVTYAVCGSSPCQDEWLATPALDLSTLTTPTLSFFNNGNAYWSCHPGVNDNYSFKVYLSTAGATPADFLAGTEIWDFCGDSPADGYAWTSVALDLAAYATDTVYIGFNYVGDDGAGHYIDLVRVGEPASGACCLGDSSCSEGTAVACTAAGGTYQGDDTTCATTTCPTVPTNDTCDTATEIRPETTDTVFGELLTLGNDVDVSCNSSSATEARFGAWYHYVPETDGDLYVEETGAEDVVLAVFTGSCVAPVEQVCTDSPESITYAVTAGTDYWILVAVWWSATDPVDPYIMHFTGPLPVTLQRVEID